MKYTYATIVCLLGGFIACESDQVRREIIRPVRTEQVFSTGRTRIRTFSGVARSGTESNLSFKVPGTVSRVTAKLGDQVRKNQILAQLDAEDYEIQEKEAEAARDQARAKEVQAEGTYERAKTLYENKSIGKSELEAARAAYETAHEQDNIAKKRRALARNQSGYTDLKAPVDGAISEVRIEVNEYVKSGQTVFVLTSGSELEVQIGIPEVLITQISAGANVSVHFDALPGKSFSAIVTEVGVASTGYATTYPVNVRLKKAEVGIRPGMAAEVDFTFSGESERNCYFVTPVAVSEDRLGRFVFTVEPGDSGLGIIHKKPVEIGDLTGDGLEVFTGLEDGDFVVTAGVSKIHEGMKVKFSAAGAN